ncbi:MAG: transcriptional modulator of MazE/toxin, MazF [Flavisolibacter sp.]|jgi:mRNA interferase MazF|nr:transcriptional modulator of MazE/toxin, MazF [Flavisolibacter sp.]
MKQFDVYLINFDPTIGAEIKKTRPGVIVSPDDMNKNLQTIIVAPLTHKTKNYPSRVFTLFKNQNGQVILDQLRSVDKQRLIKKQGVIDAATASDIKLVLQTMFC